MRPRRWAVERTFSWISEYRGCMRAYATSSDHHEAMIYLSVIMTMSRRITRADDR